MLVIHVIATAHFTPSHQLPGAAAFRPQAFRRNQQARYVGPGTTPLQLADGMFKHTAKVIFHLIGLAHDHANVDRIGRLLPLHELIQHHSIINPYPGADI